MKNEKKKKKKKTQKTKGKNKKVKKQFPLSSKPKLIQSKNSFIDIKKRFDTHLVASPILLAEFGISVSSV